RPTRYTGVTSRVTQSCRGHLLVLTRLRRSRVTCLQTRRRRHCYRRDPRPCEAPPSQLHSEPSRRAVRGNEPPLGADLEDILVADVLSATFKVGFPVPLLLGTSGKLV